jgi:hypothetical protein
MDTLGLELHIAGRSRPGQPDQDRSEYSRGIATILATREEAANSLSAQGIRIS